MKILFANYKGGSGKTVLAIHLANYLHYYRNSETALVSFQKAGDLTAIASRQQCPYAVRERILTPSNIYADAEHLVMDGGLGVLSEYAGELVSQCDVLVTPFQYQLLDFQCLKSFFNFIMPFCRTDKRYFAIPNLILRHQQQNSREAIDGLIREHGFCLLPPIISSKYISLISFKQPSRQAFTVYRAAFSKLL